MTSKTGPRAGFILTGAAGFLGSRLADRLLAEGMAVAALDIRASNSHPHPALRVYQGELGQTLPAALAAMGPGCTLVHLAGQPDANFCEKNPSAAHFANVELFEQVLTLSVAGGVSHAILVSTGMVLDTDSPHPLDEDEPYAPKGVYAHSKMEAEVRLKSFMSDRTGISGTTVRLANVYGPGAHKGTVIDRIHQQVRHGHELRLKTLAPHRDFLYESDAVEGLARIALAPPVETHCILHLSTGISTSIRALAETFLTVAHKDLLLVEEEPQPNRASGFALKNERLKEKIHWEPRIRLAEGLEKLWRAEE